MARPLVLAGLLAMVLETGSAAQQPVFRTGTDVVGFGVTVTDRRGNFITDLKPDDLEILEEGVPQGIQLFTRGDETETAPEMHIGLVFDTSGSMGDDITLARSAAVKFLNTLTDAKDMTLVDFDTEVRVSKFEQASFPRLVERIRARKPDGLTALYDAIGVYLTGAADDSGRKILVMFTDGGDTRSTTTFSKLVTMLRASEEEERTIFEQAEAALDTDREAPAGADVRANRTIQILGEEYLRDSRERGKQPAPWRDASRDSMRTSCPSLAACPWRSGGSSTVASSWRRVRIRSSLNAAARTCAVSSPRCASSRGRWAGSTAASTPSTAWRSARPTSCTERQRSTSTHACVPRRDR